MNPEIVTVPLGDRTYDIFFGRDIYPVFQEWICRFFPGGSVFVVSDRNVASIYGDDIRRWLTGIAHSVHAVPPGEEHKTWETVREIYRALARGGADRDSLVVAFGGGVTGDLAGFAAATFLRGIPYVQIPTTLLAQVDSSVGGKTGFNLPEGKNLVGAFHQPRAVFIDHTFLRTLDTRNLRAGMAEIVKCGLAGDEALWDLVRRRASSWREMPDAEWLEAIRRSVAFKAAVVGRDERESSIRRVLNLGHTIGHALEQASGYGRLLHGEAVAVGLAWEAVFARRLRMTPPEIEEALCETLLAMGFALDDPELALTSIASAIGMDKKRSAGDLLLPVVTAPARCVLKRIPLSLLRKELPSIRSEIRDRLRALSPEAREERELADLVERGDAAAAIGRLEKRVAEDPRNSAAMLLLAQAYLRTGNAAGAWETVKAALERDPGDRGAQRLAREIEARLPAASGDQPPHPLEEVIVLEEGTFALRPAEEEDARPAERGEAQVAEAAAPAAAVPGETPGPEGVAEVSAAESVEPRPIVAEREGGAASPEQAGVEDQAAAGAEPPPPPAGSARPEPAIAEEPPAPAAPAEAIPVRTITMANVYWEQGERETARRIVREILSASPGDARAAAWLAERGESDEEAALAAYLEVVAKEYGHDLSRAH